MGLTKSLVNYARNTRYEDIPAHVIEVEKRSLLDIVGVMLGATGLGEGCQEIRQYVKATDRGADSRLIGFGERASCEGAALVNGALAHALDFEDSQDIAMQHSNSVPVPLSLTLADMLGGVSGKELITAMTIGSDCACRLALGLDVDLTNDGWYMQPIHGSMGGVLAGARLLGLSDVQTLDAIAINSSMVSGLAEVVNSPASLIRAIRDGLASKSAAFSLQLAKSGISTRFEQAFEGKQGYYRAYSGTRFTPERAEADLGKVFQSELVGFKPWPCCRLTHPAVGALLEIMDENGLTSEDITNVHLVMNNVCRMVSVPREMKLRPQNTPNAKFSVMFSLGVAAVKRALKLSDFEADALNDPAVLDFAERVTVEYDDSLPKSKILDNIITVTTPKGTFTKHVTAPFGAPERPMSDDLFIQKFRDCASYAYRKYTSAEIDRLIDTILHVEELADARELTELL